MGLAVALGGCSGSPSSPATTTEFFTAPLVVQGDLFYSFNALSNGTVDVTLVSVTLATPGPAVATPLTLGVGIPQGTGCPSNTSISTGPGFSAQLSAQVTQGIHCVDIHDAGTLTNTVNFAVRIVHP